MDRYQWGHASYKEGEGRYALTLDHWSDRGYSKLEVQLWDDVDGPTCIWRGSVRELGEIVVQWVGRQKLSEAQNARLINPSDLPDLLHSYAESLVDHDSGTIHPSSVLTAYEFLESEGWIEGGRWTEICDRCAPIHCPGSENCSVALDYERAKGGRRGG